MDIGKLLIFGAVGYFAYEYFLAGPSTAPVSTAPGGIIPATGLAVNPSTTQSLMLAKMSRDNFTRGTVDEFDTYYQAARGIPAPDPITDWGFTDANRNEQLTFEEWWAIASAHGLSGYRRAY